MKYADMSTKQAVLSFLENRAPAKPRVISKYVGRNANSVYSALYTLNKEGKIKNLGVAGWTTVHRAPKKQVVKDTPTKENTVRQYGADEVQRLADELDKAYAQVAEYRDKYKRLHAIASYLEKRNGQLLAHVWETGGNITLGENP